MSRLSIQALRMAAANSGFQYSDIPNQLLRINSVEGSLGFSGAVLTSVTDMSPSAQTVTVTGSPVYTASDTDLNGKPSFTAIKFAAYVRAAGVDQSLIRFITMVICRSHATNGLWLIDGIADAYTLDIAASSLEVPGKIFNGIPGEGSIGRKRIAVAQDASTQCLWNGTSIGTAPVPAEAGIGITIGSSRTADYSGARVAFLMLSSVVPSAPMRAALEAKLIEDFG